MTTPTNPLFAASHVQNMASKAGSNKMAFAVLTGLSIAFLSVMVIRECKDIFKDLLAGSGSGKKPPYHPRIAHAAEEEHGRGRG
jgi:hypothetical protein